MAYWFTYPSYFTSVHSAELLIYDNNQVVETIPLEYDSDHHAWMAGIHVERPVPYLLRINGQFLANSVNCHYELDQRQLYSVLMPEPELVTQEQLTAPREFYTYTISNEIEIRKSGFAAQDEPVCLKASFHNETNCLIQLECVDPAESIVEIREFVVEPGESVQTAFVITKDSMPGQWRFHLYSGGQFIDGVSFYIQPRTQYPKFVKAPTVMFDRYI